LAIGILGWPIDKIPSEYAKRILEGANFICAEHKIPLAGGHSIDCPEPVFGLAVTGRIHINHLKVNSGAKPGDCIYLTKGLGIGVLTTAEKKSIISPQHKDLAKSSMVKSNKIGQFISEYSEVHAMTDVTGFGLAGHLLEMCEASELNAKIHYVNLPAIDTCVFEYIKQGAVPGGTHRNWKSYGSKVSLSDESWISFVADPQTSGGLLIAIDPNFKNEFEKLLSGQNQEYFEIGQFVEKKQTPAFRIQIS
jgi:selenide, water dikinase